MVITFSNIKGSTGGGGATGGTVSGITLWSDETTKAYIDNALSGVTDVLSAYTKTEDFATINGSAITSGGNLVIEATPYTAGANIDITDHIISVTGITVPTKVSELVNDSGYITTADTQNFATSGDVQTQINDSISGKADSSAVTAQISEVKAQIEAEIPTKVSSLENDLNFASTGDVESMISGFTTSADVKTQIEGYNYINSGQAQTQIDNSISGKLDTDIFTAYTANTKTELDNKQDISGMTAYATTAFTESTYAKIGDIPTKTSDLTNDSGFITDAALLGYATEQYVDNSVSGKVDNSALTQYYTSAQTDTAISNAVSGKLDASAITAYSTTEEVENMITAATNGLASEEWVNNQGFLKEHQSLSAYSTTEQMNQAIGSATAATTGWVESQGYLTEHQSLSAYTPTSGFSTINGSAITEGGNIVVEETPYSGGANIDITDHIISVTGITVPTSNTAFTNDAGYVTSGEVETQITGKNYATESWVQDNVNLAIESETARTESTYAKIGDIPSLDGYATTGWVESQGYLTEHQDISGKLDTNVFTTYTASTQTELNNKQDASAMTAYATTAFTESTYLKEHQSLSAYSTTEQVQTLINTAKQEVENEIPDVSNFVTSAQVETQITDKGYLTGYTESDPVFMASAASGISAQDITNWNAKLDSSDLEPYYTSAQTNNAISDAVSVKADLSAVTAQISEVKAQIEAEIPTKVSDLQNDLNFASTGDVQTQIDNATSGKQDTLVSGVNIKTINNESILGSGNIVIQGGGSGSDYSAGANIDITDNVISVTGITLPTKLSELTNDSGYINSGQAQTQIDNSVSGKVDTDIFKAYTANTKTEIDNAVSVKADSSRVDEIEEVTASALVELHNTKQDILVSGTNIKTINNESILGSGNIEIQGGGGSDYSAGVNIDITNNVISVTGITVPTSTSALTNDSGYVTSGEVNTQIESKGYITGYTETDPVFQASAARGITSQDITNWNGKQPSGDYALRSELPTVPTSNTAFTNDAGYITDAALNGYATTAFTESTYLKEHQSLSAYTPTSGFSTINGNVITDGGNIVVEETPYSGGTNIDITDHIISVTGITIPTSNTAFTNDAGYVTSGEVETQITNKGYLTAYTESDPVFQASAASGISEQDITNWNNKLDSSALNPYYTSAQTDTAISNAVSGKTDKVSVTASSSGYKFPKWNEQGCITGTSATAFQASQSINGSIRKVYADIMFPLPTIYAPTSAGSAGQPLLSNGSGAPVWGSYKFQFISQSQYDALTTKDSTTIYFIVNEN